MLRWLKMTLFLYLFYYVRGREIGLQLRKFPAGVCVKGIEYCVSIAALLERNNFAGTICQPYADTME